MIFINVKINKVLFNKIQIDVKNTFPSPDMIVDSSRKKNMESILLIIKIKTINPNSIELFPFLDNKKKNIE